VIGDEIETRHIFDPETGQFLGSVPASDGNALSRLRKEAADRRAANLKAQRELAGLVDRTLEQQARFALNQPWYIQADVADACGMAMTSHALSIVTPIPALEQGDLSRFGPDLSRFEPNLAPFERRS
jgi:hypothetical protein